MAHHLARLYYCAGYFDGEGCITVAKNTRISVRIISGDKESLQMFSEEFGGSVEASPYHSPHALVCLFRWDRNGAEAVEMLRKIEPFLVAKRSQAQLVINSGWTDFNQFKRGSRKGDRRISPQQIELRRNLKISLRNAKNENRKDNLQIPIAAQIVPSSLSLFTTPKP